MTGDNSDGLSRLRARVGHLVDLVVTIVMVISGIARTIGYALVVTRQTRIDLLGIVAFGIGNV
jgi:cytochrome b561